MTIGLKTPEKCLNHLASWSCSDEIMAPFSSLIEWISLPYFPVSTGLSLYSSRRLFFQAANSACHAMLDV